MPNAYSGQNPFRPIFKKPILGLRIESKLRIAGVCQPNMVPEHLFSLGAWFKRKQMFGWHLPCDSQLGSNPQAQDWFFEYGS